MSRLRQERPSERLQRVLEVKPGPDDDSPRWHSGGKLSHSLQGVGEIWHDTAHWRRVFIAFSALGLVVAALANFLTVTYMYRTDLAELQKRSVSTAASIARRIDKQQVRLARAPEPASRPVRNQLQASLWSEIWINDSIDAAHVLVPQGGELIAVATASKRSDEASLTIRKPGDNWSRARIRWLESPAGERFFRVVVPLTDDSGAVPGVFALDLSPRQLVVQRNRVLTALAVGLGLFALLWLGQAYWLAFFWGAPVDRLVTAVRSIRGHGGALIPADSLRDLAPAAEVVNELTWAALERDRLQEALTKYVSANVARAVAEHESWITTTGKERRITIVFADIYQFTELSQSMSSARVVEMLNNCFSSMAYAVHRYNGMIDKFIGDGMMALFGAPHDDPKHAEHAVLAALEIQAEFARLRQELNQPGLRVGIGINTGEAIVGNIGSEDRIQYTAIGAPVNLASRLESFSRSVGGGIIIGYDTAGELGDEFVLERVDGTKLKGVEQLQTLFKVKDRNKRATADLETVEQPQD